VSAAYSPVDEGPVPNGDISIVVQGPLQRNGVDIRACLDAIARHLPGAEVIISTWQTEDVSGLVGCSVIRSPDPGGIEDISGNTINLSRQALSTLAGLELATRPWVLKTRVDVPLAGRAMALATRYGEAVPAEYRLFRRPLVVPSLFTRDPARVPFLFHPSDVAQFGLRDDLLEFWRGPPFRAEDLLVTGRPSLNPFGNYAGFTQQRVVPEQALMLRWLRARGIEATLDRPDAVTRRTAILSERVLLANFRILGAERAGLDFPEHFRRVLPALKTVYREEEVPMIARDAYERPARRFARIWLRKYVFCFVTPFWVVTIGNLLLRSISPRLADRVRAAYRRILGYRRDATR
jgi:hypothetical protein